MEEMRENPRLAGRVELCEEILHFCRGVGIKGDGSNPRGRGEYLHQLLGSQVFLSLWEKKKRTKRDPRVRSGVWWGQGSLGLLETLSSKVRTRRRLCERKVVRACSHALQEWPGHSVRKDESGLMWSSKLSLGDLLISENNGD